ncbi:DUF427 domain-containing protein [Aquibium sp. ELW1220]|uniref:DUF427 domain-containing protein n=1 Tax=Aquibium sp. ELW1220 TaxID=2976766 RepID=UPI0025B2495C|nr:DUF427 domain-containing protein [Aquibium sp. ELW1220]MDN2582156.1 DUF427 domain-containing protein [Aquibium sp. ELW1220]
MTNLSPENVQSFPCPSALHAVPPRIAICTGGLLAAETVNTLRVLETHHAPSDYLPLGDEVATLRARLSSSFCDWKGVARYFDMISGEQLLARRLDVWTPHRAFRRPGGIRGLLCRADG